MNDEMELRNNKGLAIFAAIGSSFILGYSIYDTRFFAKSKHHQFEWFIFGLFLVVALASWTGYFDKSVQVRINNDGIFWTKKILFFHFNKQLLWTDIESCYLTDNTSRGVQDLNLNFTSKTKEIEYKLSMNGYDKNCKEISDIIEFYSKRFQFGFLGIDNEI